MDQTLRSSYPFGGTPLTRHLLNIRPIIADMAPRLWQEGRKATIVLATDGLPSTDHDENNVQIQDFIQALKSFENLPVWIVIRLCTDDEKVFDFYNSLDVHVSLALDVLDDLVGEALEVYLRNPWLTYGLPIHRVRELGFPHAVMDAIDEHMLSYHELQVFCSLLFANQVFPDPAQDWTNFLRCVAHAVSTERLQWNPVTKCPSPWIDIVRLNTIYGRNQPLPREFLYPTSVAGNTSLPSTGMTTSSAIHLGQHKHAVPISPSAVSGQQPPSLNPLFTIPDKGAPTSASYSQPAPSRHSFDRHEGPQYQQSRGSPYPQQQQRHQHHQQQQSRVTPSVPLTEPEYSADHHLSVIKKQLMQQWGLQPPSFKSLRPIDQLLNSVHHALPPAFGVASHSYFLKFKPFSPEALGSQNSAVIQRGTCDIKT